MALIRPISPSGRISGLILKNIRNISIVQGPTPLMVIRLDFIVSSLASKASIVLYDGSPFTPNYEHLFKISENFIIFSFKPLTTTC